MQAIEEEPLDSRIQTPLVTSLIAQGALVLVAPAPLGEQRQRFLALVHDMHTRGDDYLDQLSMLSLAGMNQRQESKSTIVSSLLNRVDIVPAQQAEEQLLWQARLTLKLGEMYEMQQADLHQALGSILRQKEHLLAELKDEEEDIFALTESIQGGMHEEVSLVSHRLKAWTRLYFHAPPPVSPALFVTGYEGAIDALEEAYLHLTGQHPTRLAGLVLPTYPGAPIPLINPADRLIERCAEPARKAFNAMGRLSDYAPTVLGEMTATMEGYASEWRQHLNNGYPADRYGRCILDLLAYPSVTAQQLFRKGFCGSGPLPATAQSGDTSLGVMVGLVRTAKKESAH